MTNEELVVLIQDGHTELVPELWQQVERFVAWKALRIIRALNGIGGVEFADLYDTGYIAMVNAVETFQAETGSFTNWLMYHLKKEFAVTAGYSTQKQKNEPLRYAASLSALLSEEDGRELGDIIPDPAGERAVETVEERIFREQLKTALQEALEDMPEDWANVLRERHYQGKSFHQIADEKAISHEAIRKQERKALSRIRKSRHMERLRSFVDFDYFAGTGVGAFRSTGMSVQERYLMKLEKMQQ